MWATEIVILYLHQDGAKLFLVILQSGLQEEKHTFCLIFRGVGPTLRTGGRPLWCPTGKAGKGWESRTTSRPANCGKGHNGNLGKGPLGIPILCLFNCSEHSMRRYRHGVLAVGYERFCHLSAGLCSVLFLPCCCQSSCKKGYKSNTQVSLCALIQMAQWTQAHVPVAFSPALFSHSWLFGTLGLQKHSVQIFCSVPANSGASWERMPRLQSHRKPNFLFSSSTCRLEGFLFNWRLREA